MTDPLLECAKIYWASGGHKDDSGSKITADFARIVQDATVAHITQYSHRDPILGHSLAHAGLDDVCRADIAERVKTRLGAK